MSAELQIWSIFLLLNSLFFIPRYWMERHSSAFLPIKGLLSGPISERVRYVINRFNYDIFRMSFDFFLLCLLFYFLGDFFSLTGKTTAFLLIFLVLWAYQLYYHSFESIYRIEPVLYSDALMLKTGTQLFFRNLVGVNLFIVFAIFGLFTVIGFGLHHLLSLFTKVEFSILSYLAFVIIILLGIYSLLNYNYKAFGKIVFPSQTQSLIRNIKVSRKVKAYFDHFDFEGLGNHRPYAHLKLKEKPNVYFLVVESYGKVLYDHPALKEDYKKQMATMQLALAANGWAACTHLSTSPITAGASWVSYTSALFGLKIQDQGAYVTLLHRPEIRKYEHFMRWLQNQGYKNYRPSSIAGFKGMKIPWDDYQEFYALDKWIKYEEMDYSGKLYGFGPCPPDQFTLGFANQLASGDAPHFLFMITQNSHSPFVAPPLMENWTTVNDGTQGTDLEDSSSIFVQPKLEDYQAAIAYQLKFIEQFILQEAKPTDVFILMGDHQPPAIAIEKDGMETPVHIISQDEELVQHFKQYGFEEGLWKANSNTFLNHESIFSMLVRAFYERFGDGTQDLPPYLANGIEFGDAK
jgi:hypothetical protein